MKSFIQFINEETTIPNVFASIRDEDVKDKLHEETKHVNLYDLQASHTINGKRTKYYDPDHSEPQKSAHIS